MQCRCTRFTTPKTDVVYTYGPPWVMLNADDKAWHHTILSPACRMHVKLP